MTFLFSYSLRRALITVYDKTFDLQSLLTEASWKLHVFTGERVQVDKLKGAPAWMPDKIWKPIVKKVGVEKLEEL